MNCFYSFLSPLLRIDNIVIPAYSPIKTNLLLDQNKVPKPYIFFKDFRLYYNSILSFHLKHTVLLLAINAICCLLKLFPIISDIIETIRESTFENKFSGPFLLSL